MQAHVTDLMGLIFKRGSRGSRGTSATFIYVNDIELQHFSTLWLMAYDSGMLSSDINKLIILIIFRDRGTFDSSMMEPILPICSVQIYQK